MRRVTPPQSSLTRGTENWGRLGLWVSLSCNPVPSLPGLVYSAVFQSRTDLATRLAHKQ